LSKAKHLILLSVILFIAPSAFATDYEMYIGIYGDDCVDDEPSQIYGGTYSEYPKGLVDAKFPGGDVELSLFIFRNTEIVEVYSGEKDNQGNPLLVTGDVLVEFVIDRCGQPCKFKVVQSLTPEQDAEALRVMESMPMFRAATLDGYRVKSAYIAPIHFQHDHYPQKPAEFNYDDYVWY